MNLYKYNFGGFERHFIAESYADAEKMFYQKHPGKKLDWINSIEQDIYIKYTLKQLIKMIFDR